MNFNIIFLDNRFDYSLTLVPYPAFHQLEKLSSNFKPNDEVIIMKKMRGAVDPITLGFILIALGAGVASKTSLEKDANAQVEAQTPQVVVVAEKAK